MLPLFSWQFYWAVISVITVTGAFKIPGIFSSPNIVFIMVDDMGWNDVSFHGSNQILTPNLDALALRSVILQQYYSEAICTPARTALLTGKYPLRLGMYGFPLFNSEDRGIPLTEKLLPTYLKELGYSTHLVGKWHVGMSDPRYMPEARGYDTHYGMRGGFIDYYTYDKVETWPNGRIFSGFDFFDGNIPQINEERYVVDALTDRAKNIIKQHNTSCPLFLHIAHNAPHAGNYGGALQTPLYQSVQNKHIANSDRRLYAEIVRHIDNSVAEIVNTLAEANMLEDTIIVFASDNGAPTVGEFSNWGINLPFRGKKSTPWEGAVRVPAFVWHASFRPRVWNGLMHISDWLPTLIAAAGGEVDRTIDGVNQWDSIIQGSTSQRNEVLIAVEDSDRNVYAAYRAGDYKIVVGNVTGVSNSYYGEQFLAVKDQAPDYLSAVKTCQVTRIFERMGSYLSREEIISTRKASTIRSQGPVTNVTLCEPTPDRGCLYNIRQDPSERRDLWEQETNIALTLTSRLSSLWAMQQSRGPLALSIEADPANFNYIWMPWVNTNETFSEDNPKTDVKKYNVKKSYDSYSYQKNLNKNIPVTAVVNCEGATVIKNILCFLRSVF